MQNAPNALAALVATALADHLATPNPHPQYATITTGGALELPILDTDPPAPTNGGALLYVHDSGGGVTLRVRTAAGVVTVGP